VSFDADASPFAPLLEHPSASNSATAASDRMPGMRRRRLPSVNDSFGRKQSTGC
jgi:hypothetical protein